MPLAQILAGEEIIRVTFLWAQVQEDIKYSSVNSDYLNIKLAWKGEGENEKNTYISLEKQKLGKLGNPKTPDGDSS